jgi:two-component system response regulator MprA
VTAGRILVVEDDAPVASVLERGLQLAGYEVTVAPDGAEARVRWSAGGFDVVVLDVMLPGVSGVELCRTMRDAGDTTPVVLLTAREDDELRRAGLAAGASAYVTKPFVYAELMTLIRALRAGDPSRDRGIDSRRPSRFR